MLQQPSIVAITLVGTSLAKCKGCVFSLENLLDFIGYLRSFFGGLATTQNVHNERTSEQKIEHNHEI